MTISLPELTLPIFIIYFGRILNTHSLRLEVFDIRSTKRVSKIFGSKSNKINIIGLLIQVTTLMYYVSFVVSIFSNNIIFNKLILILTGPSYLLFAFSVICMFLKGIFYRNK